MPLFTVIVALCSVTRDKPPHCWVVGLAPVSGRTERQQLELTDTDRVMRSAKKKPGKSGVPGAGSQAEKKGRLL